MLPPLATLFYSEDLEGLSTLPRLLSPGNNSRIDLSEALKVASARCHGARRDFESVAGPNGLFELLSGFVDFMRNVTEESLEGPNK